MKKAIIVAAIALFSVFAVAPVVSAQSDTVNIPVSTIAYGNNGTEKVLTTKNVPNGEYTVTVKAINQDSVHPNTDIIVRSGPAEKVTVHDVERKAFGSETAEDTLIVQDGKVTVSVRFGKDGVFSGGVKVILTEVPEKPEEPTEPQTSSTNTDKEVLPATLPETGAGSAIAIFAGASSLGYVAHATVSRKSRRQ